MGDTTENETRESARQAGDEADLAALPVWLNRGDVREKLGVPRSALSVMVCNGDVRRRKLGDAKHCTVLYRTRDIWDAIVASGKGGEDNT